MTDVTYDKIPSSIANGRLVVQIKKIEPIHLSLLSIHILFQHCLHKPAREEIEYYVVNTDTKNVIFEVTHLFLPKSSRPRCFKMMST